MLDFEKLQSPAFKAVVGIAQYVGPGMVVTDQRAIAFPRGQTQVWKFTPATLPLDRAAIAIVVWVVQQQLDSWTPWPGDDFAAAVAHYEALAQATWKTAKETPPVSPTPAAPTGPTRVIHLGLPAGVSLHWSGANGPPLLAGKPVQFVMGGAGGAS